jgi:hypothetical protein
MSYLPSSNWVCLQTNMNETRLGRSAQVIPIVHIHTMSTSHWVPADHEVNIRGGGNTVHVVLQYLPRRLLQKGAEKRLPPHPHPISQLILDSSFKDDVTVILNLGVSFMLRLLEKAQNDCLMKMQKRLFRVK